jgi:hypothetical protein
MPHTALCTFQEMYRSTTTLLVLVVATVLLVPSRADISSLPAVNSCIADGPYALNYINTNSLADSGNTLTLTAGYMKMACEVCAFYSCPTILHDCDTGEKFVTVTETLPDSGPYDVCMTAWENPGQPQGEFFINTGSPYAYFPTLTSSGICTLLFPATCFGCPANSVTGTNTVTGCGNTVSGTGNTVSGNFSNVTGTGNTISGNNVFISGNNNTVTGNTNTAMNGARSSQFVPSDESGATYAVIIFGSNNVVTNNTGDAAINIINGTGNLFQGNTVARGVKLINNVSYNIFEGAHPPALRHARSSVL